MVIRVLGPEYVLREETATIEFKRPSRSTVYATFALDKEETETVRAELTQQPSVDRVYHVELTDADAVVYASVDKTIHIRRKEAEQNLAEGA